VSENVFLNVCLLTVSKSYFFANLKR
jgi:hypothetical protein